MATPLYDLPCPECGKISRKSLVELETEPRLPCGHCGISIRVTNYYGLAEINALAEREGRVASILRDRDKDK